MGHLFEKKKRIIRRRAAKWGAFARNSRGAIAVEMAFILPIFVMLALLTWDTGTVYTQYNRSIANIYSFGDVISNQTDDLTCDRLDQIAELVYRSYSEGNWARRVREGSEDFTRDGAPDFRFIVRLIEAVEQPDGTIKGDVKWEYRRHPGDVELGEPREIPEALQTIGLRFIMVDGQFSLAPSINYLGLFDPDGDGQLGTVPVDRYFPLRFVPGIGLEEKPDDQFDNKCSAA